ncbi:MAG: 1-acyl-sn-glycerol-3-phosphate acyltransferase [Candidatus Paracaedimonas acanthamoebae]|uniref:1-acyl-sn-glycerol-3-phosphate acyltransferase n=1 Tax=Candidatus Paracaedimonas acanthamoebae TaxID=244581 RepID=A0A8J7PMC9_9PROT|nr:1-acyl-sn-glycerol-3-phosphate acyltransferase [Candidatus Paracaedimonas acanthamoebae]
MIIFIRSIIFNILFYVWTFIVVVSALPALVIGRQWTHRISRYWGNGVTVLLHLVGIQVEIRGRHYLPSEPAIIASKHQSAWETTMIEIFVPEAVIILKKELIKIPLFGRLLLNTGVISIDRSKGRSVIPQMVEGAKHAKEQGRSLFIFPEGTRTTAGERGTYRYGTYALYHQTGMKVVPAAHNAGFFWPRRKFLKNPGKIIFEFLPPIEPGLSEKDFMKKLEESIESACEILHPFKKGPQSS